MRFRRWMPVGVLAVLTIHSSRKDVQEMQPWPEEGCVKKIDDIIVCKMGE